MRRLSGTALRTLARYGLVRGRLSLVCGLIRFPLGPLPSLSRVRFASGEGAHTNRTGFTKRCFTLASLTLASLSHAVVHYGIDFQPTNKQVQVTIQLDSPNKVETFRIPAWSPGYYQIAKYQDGLSNVEAKATDGLNLSVTSDGPRAWKVQDPELKPYTLTYSVAGNDPGLGFFGTAVHDQDGFVNGASAFMNVDGRIKEPAHLRILTPPGWDVATPLDPGVDGDLVANGYDELIDSPIQAGRFVRKTFVAGGIPFQVIYVSPDGQIRADLDAETDRFSKLVTPALALFDGAPFKRYTFYIHLAPGSFSGGLEHRACTVIDIQNSRPFLIDDLATHEYFHAWNIKNIRPAVLGPFDYTKEVRTDNLWFGEGVTDYYAKLTAYQSGLDDVQWLYEQLTQELAILQHSRSRSKYTLAQASRGAWEGESEGLGDLSYYDKGLLVGLVLDSEIRDATHGEKSLDDVMRLLFDEHHLPLPGYAEGEIREKVNLIAGVDMSSVYDTMVYTTKEMPFKELEKLGIRAILKSQPYRDTGFHIDESGKIISMVTGLKTQGLQVDDIVTLEKIDGDQAKFKVDRGQQTFHAVVTVHTSLGDEYRIEPDPLASPERRKLRTAWLHKLAS